MTSSSCFSFEFAHRLGVNAVSLYACAYHGIPFYLLHAPPWFGAEEGVYGDWDWDMQR